MYYNVYVLLFVIVCVYVCLFLGTTLYRHFSLLWNPSLGKIDNNNNNNNYNNSINTEYVCKSRGPTVVEILSTLPEITGWKSEIKH